jgi:hypothetical protein
MCRAPQDCHILFTTNKICPNLHFVVFFLDGSESRLVSNSDEISFFNNMLPIGHYWHVFSHDKYHYQDQDRL